MDRVSKESTSFAIITLTTEGEASNYIEVIIKSEVFSANSGCAKLVLHDCLLCCRKVRLVLLFNYSNSFRCEMRVNSYWDPTSCQGCFEHIEHAFLTEVRTGITPVHTPFLPVNLGNPLPSMQSEERLQRPDSWT